MEEPLEPDPVIEAYKRDVDRTLLVENLRLDVAVRCDKFAGATRLFAELRESQRPAGAAPDYLAIPPPFPDFPALVGVLRDAGVESIVVGDFAGVVAGLACSVDSFEFVYRRAADNASRLVEALSLFSPFPRRAPKMLPFEWSVATIQRGLNFDLATTLGRVWLLGEIPGGGGYDDLLPESSVLRVFGRDCRVLDLPALIRVKRAAGRPKDFEVLAQLEALLEERTRLGMG